MPLVSIIVPTFNRKDTLFETLKSVSDQSENDFECLIIDDESTDASKTIFEESSYSADPRFRWLQRADYSSDSGAQVARNIGIRESSGQYLLFLDSDDLLHTNCLEERLKLFAAHSDADMVVGTCERFATTAGDMPGSLWPEWSEHEDFLNSFVSLQNVPWQTSGPLWTRQAVSQTGTWDEELVKTAHDCNYHTRALAKGLKAIPLQSVDYYWRIPRQDSLSDFDANKDLPISLQFLEAFFKTCQALTDSGTLNPERKALLKARFVRAIIRLRMSGAAQKQVGQSIRRALEHKIISPVERLQLLLFSAVWFKVLTKNVGLFLLNRFLVRQS